MPRGDIMRNAVDQLPIAHEATGEMIRGQEWDGVGARLARCDDRSPYPAALPSRSIPGYI